MIGVSLRPLLIFLCFGSTVAPAFAYLGGDSNSVQADRQSARDLLRSTPMVQYTVQEIAMESGTTVHEYLSRAGKVFALTWKGPVVPDLRQLLGEYFDRYAHAAWLGDGQALRRHIEVAQPNLIVQSSGHLGAFNGRAYVPSLVPAGIAVDDLP